MLTVSEGTSTSKYTKNQGYDVIVNGIGGEPKTFTDYSKHPNILATVNNKGLKSTAARNLELFPAGVQRLPASRYVEVRHDVPGRFSDSGSHVLSGET